jgi:Ulp1 family protease
MVKKPHKAISFSSQPICIKHCFKRKNKNINCHGKYSFKSVEDWINNLINDTNLAKLFIPINIDNIHWVLIVVDIIQGSIHYYDSCHAEKDEQIQRLKNIEHFMNDFEKKKVPEKKIHVVSSFE